MIKLIKGNEKFKSTSLSVMDSLDSKYITFSFVYSYRLNEVTLIDNIKKILDIYPHAGGRVRDKNTDLPTIVTNNDGIIFSYVEYGKKIKKYDCKSNMKSNDDTENFVFDCGGTSLDEYTPLILLKLSNFLDGAVLSMSFSHYLCDLSSMYFLRDLSKLYCGKEVVPPAQGRDYINEMYQNFRFDDYEQKPKIEFDLKICDKENDQASFYLKEKDIERMYDDLLSVLEEDEFISRQDMVSAFIVKNMLSCIEDKAEDFYLAFTRDARKMLELPKNYFGNAIFNHTVSNKNSSFLNKNTLKLAKLLREEFNKLSIESIFSFVKNTESKKKGSFGGVRVFFDNVIGVNDCTIASVKDIDFGSGFPVWYENTTQLYRKFPIRFITIWPSLAEQGGVIYEISMPKKELDILLNTMKI